MSNLFIYPKFASLVNLSKNEVEIPLEHKTLVWLGDVLSEHYNDRIKTITNYRSRPWSQIFEVLTCGNRLFFLKVPNLEFYAEASIIELLENTYPDITIKSIAQNKNNGSFLMAALEGETLRAQVRKQANQSTLVSSASNMGKFQKDIRVSISKFEQLKIPKWTSKTIIEDCESIIANDRYLSLSTISNIQINAFRSLYPAIEEKLVVLTKLDGGLSLDHGDFQDNNIFITDDRSFFLDWADASITIPSFTIATYCHSVLLAHSNILNKPQFTKTIVANYYFSLLGSKYNELNEAHISLVHYLYPIMCILKTGRLLKMSNTNSDKYVSSIIDYWIRIVISFSRFYCDKTLSNKSI